MATAVVFTSSWRVSIPPLSEATLSNVCQFGPSYHVILSESQKNCRLPGINPASPPTRIGVPLPNPSYSTLTEDLIRHPIQPLLPSP